MAKITNFTSDAVQIKYDILKRVAELAYEGTLEENIDQIPFDLIPGNVAKFRCCVYKEREIVRGRVRLTQAKSAQPGEEAHVVNVIKAACEGCPINRFRVTENCQRCMAKHCVAACPFNAISISGKGAYIDTDKCRECGRCAKACPYNAIADLVRPCKRSCPVDAISMDPKSKIAEIQTDKCIGCGNCARSCPFGAISDISYLVDVINLLKENDHVYAIFAPAIEGQFGPTVTVPMIKGAIEKLGFKKAYEVALGADAVAKHEGEELRHAFLNGQKMTTSCCPAFVAMIEKHFPDLVSKMSTTVSPMVATARWIKSIDKQAKIVFVGPCIAKKAEGMTPGNDVDYVLTFEELAAMIESQNISFEDADIPNTGSIYGRKFAQSGGVFNAVAQSLQEDDVELSVACVKCNGAEECKKALLLLKSGKLTEDFIEGMACEGGCIAGPAAISPVNQVRQARVKLLQLDAINEINSVLDEHDFSKIKMTR